MDMPLGQRVDYPLPGLQRPQVAPLGFTEGTPIASGGTLGASIELASENSSHVFLLCNPKSTFMCPMGPSIPGSSS